jgi:hypothetical protein
VLECWSVGVLECWSVGVLECWSVGVLECWSVGNGLKSQDIGSTEFFLPDSATPELLQLLNPSPYTFFCARKSGSFFRFRSISQAIRMQISYSKYIGPPIIAIETASGVGAKNAAATKISRNA